MSWLLLVALLAGAPPSADGRATVPGAVNPRVTQANIASTICVSGWTKTIRPTAAYTNKLKFAALKRVGVPRSQAPAYELDHDVPLDLGGAPSAPVNLWLQPYAGAVNARQKDRLENALHRMVCARKLSLIAAQREISLDWVAAYRQRFGW